MMPESSEKMAHVVLPCGHGDVVDPMGGMYVQYGCAHADHLGDTKLWIPIFQERLEDEPIQTCGHEGYDYVVVEWRDVTDEDHWENVTDEDDD